MELVTDGSALGQDVASAACLYGTLWVLCFPEAAPSQEEAVTQRPMNHSCSGLHSFLSSSWASSMDGGAHRDIGENPFKPDLNVWETLQ